MQQTDYAYCFKLLANIEKYLNREDIYKSKKEIKILQSYLKRKSKE